MKNKPCTILIVDDNEGLSRLIQKTLQRAGFIVGIADNGAKALNWIDKNPTELMLLDYKLPDMTGRQVVNTLAERGISIPFITMTGHGDERIAVDMMKLGARDYLVKDAHLPDILPLMVERIFEHLDAKKELRNSERDKSIILDNMEETVVYLDKELKIKWVNRAARESVGTKFEQLVGGSCCEVLHKTDKTYVDCPVRRVLETDQPHESEMTASDGKIWFVRGYPIREEKGNTVGIVEVLKDITEYKETEKKLLQTEKLSAMGIMVSGIAHDFNNILAIIQGNAQLLESSYREQGELVNRIRTICRAARDGAEIVRRMREFTRMGNKTSQFVPLDIRELLKQTIGFTRPRWKNMAENNGINYELNLMGVESVMDVMGNPSELREVFVNIINNALDAMPDGGHLSFNTWNESDSVFVSISDQGKGMAKDIQNNIFDPFLTTKGIEGSGLGMSVAYGIITRHGGIIEVKSNIGKGSTFTINLPVAEETVSQPEFLEPTIHEINTNNYSVLVVDDEQDICQLLNKFLSDEGYNVKTIDNGAKAIELIKKKSFDLILCDLGMPEVSGWDVIKVIMSLDEKPKVGIITGWGEKYKSLEREEMQVDFIMEKPIDLPKLLRRIKEVLLSWQK